MKSVYLAVVIIVVLALIGFGIKSNSSKNTSPPLDSTTIQENESVSQKNLDSSAYTEYSKSEFEKASGKRRVLFFFANWCPTCKPTDQNLKANQSLIPEDVTVVRVNYNDTDTDPAEKDLAQKYAVTYQHTFVQIDQNGNEVSKWNGGKIDELLKNII